MKTGAQEEILIKTIECKSHRLHKQSISSHLSPKNHSQRDRSILLEPKILSQSETTTPHLLRKISDLQLDPRFSIKKDELFKLLKGKNISISRSQSKQKKIQMQNYSYLNNKNNSALQLNRVKKTAFNHQKWRFNRQRSIVRLNEKDDKIRKMKEKVFLNTKVLSKTMEILQKSHLLRL